MIDTVKFAYILSSEIESHPQGRILNSKCPKFPDESKIKTAKLRVENIDISPGEVVFLGLGQGSWNTEDTNGFLDLHFKMEKKLLRIWNNIENVLKSANYDKEKINKIITKNEKAIKELHDKFDLNIVDEGVIINDRIQ